MTLTASEIADRLGAVCDGDGAVVITGLASLRDAGPGEITFVANPRYAAAAATTRAGAVLVARDWDKPCAAPALLRVADPNQAFAAIAVCFAPPPIQYPAGVHPTAVVAPDAVLGQGVSIGPLCVVEAGVRVGDRAVLVAQCYLGRQVTVGSDTLLYPQVTVRERVQIGDRCVIHNGAVLGSDGFGFTADDQGARHKIPQVGTVIVGNDVEIGSNTTVDRARFGKTVIGNGVKIDNLVQIAHNVVIGDHAVIVAQVGIAGSAKIEHHVILAGQAAVAGHVTVGAGAMIGGQAGIHKNVPPMARLIGSPAVPGEVFARMVVNWTKLDGMRKRLVELEHRLHQVESRAGRLGLGVEVGHQR
ncbi:MAG: UDP-3-O-(3-hydroxymyristoyl)glucosamine N-acyltransferase, partial [Kiritimatiellaeota bacterium]|nr:UDP-3-O-(3-hydroxymyristoyl)glucosamine N-acyltransferase [Kiritimatiellota bacterium]